MTVTAGRPSPSVPRLDDRVLFGAAYYPEYFPGTDQRSQFELMADAGMTVIRVGESVWSTWEPRSGQFDVDWVRPTLELAHEFGIAVVLGTPTYAIPPWLQVAHPELAAETATGRRVAWGGRQEADFTHPEFLAHADRLLRTVLPAYADHPAVIGYQIDNEPGLHLLHNRAVFERFVDELRAEYGDIETLNAAWGLVYWSHRLADFSELWVPDGNTLPQYDLAWRRFQAKLTTEFLDWQAAIVREYARPDQFVTTCLAYSRPALDDVAVMRGLDVTAANLYYGMQDHLAKLGDLARPAPWTTTGVAGLLLAADRAYGTAQERFLVTETNAQSIGASDQNLPPYPGQLTQAALAMVSRGARMIEYWHWNTLPYGTETFWGGVLPHSGRPGRVFDEVRGIGAALGALGPRLEGYRPDHDVTLMYSNASRWALDFFSPIPDAPTREHGGAYGVIVSDIYKGFIDAGLQVRILNDSQFEGSAAELVARYPVLVVPALYAVTETLIDALSAYAEAGGHLVLGIRSLVADEQARMRTETAPPRFTGLAGAEYEESSNLRTPVGVTGSEGLSIPAGATATRWLDALTTTDAEILASYQHPEFGRFAAVTTKASGAGRVTLLGTVPDRVFGAAFGRHLVPRPIAARWKLPFVTPLTIASGVTARERIWFVHNWSGEDVEIMVPAGVEEFTLPSRRLPDAAAKLGPWDVRIWTEAI